MLSMLPQDIADAHPDLRRFIDGIYDRAKLPEAHFNKRDIVTRCVNVFVANGFVDEQSVVDQCEYINNDDLSLKEAKVPFKLVAMTYQTISDFRKNAPSEVCSIAKYT
jgi:hypothetical protein